jgi:tRNA threonylcarbamoyl adenosine modification protein YeaZ
MLVLAIDTSTADSFVGLACWEGEDQAWRPVGEETVSGNAHAEQLAPMIERIVAGARHTRRQSPLGDVKAVVVGLGPGPYTGLRIGIAAAAAYADALGLPVYGVCSLDAIAEEVVERETFGEKHLLVVTDAKRREVFWARYRGERRIGPLGVCKPAELPALLGDFVPEITAGATHLLDGAALQDVPRSSVVAPSSRGLPRPVGTALRAGERPGPLTPLYLRPPDAVPPKGLPQQQGRAI